MIECSICYLRRRKLITLDCNHQLCKHCWSKWKSKELNVYKKPFPTCPMCRADQKPPPKHSALFFIVFGLFVFWKCQEHSSLP